MYVALNKDYFFADVAVQIPLLFVVYNRRYLLCINIPSPKLVYSGAHILSKVSEPYSENPVGDYPKR